MSGPTTTLLASLVERLRAALRAPTPAAEPADPRNTAVVAKGTLTLDTTPWSEVFLKGKKLGDTPLVDYPLNAGVLTLVNEQLNVRKVIEVEIRAGNTTVKKLKL